MATEPRYQVPKTSGAPANSAQGRAALTPEDLAEFMASLEYDDAPAAPADCCGDDPEYNE
jgi:hypothetical protein